MVYLNREARMKGIHEALTELLTGTIFTDQCRERLKGYGCDESETEALIRSAPKTMKPRKHKRFKGDLFPERKP